MFGKWSRGVDGNKPIVRKFLIAVVKAVAPEYSNSS